MSPGTNNRLRYCTNTGSIPSKFYIPDRLKQSKSLDNEHTKTLYFPSVPIIFPQMQNFFLQSCPKEFIRFLWEGIINLLKGNLQSFLRHRVAIFESEVSLVSLKHTTWKQRNILASERGLQLIKVIAPPVINHLS